MRLITTAGNTLSQGRAPSFLSPDPSIPHPTCRCSKFDRFVTKFDFVGWFECSAKKGVAGIDQAVYTLLNAVLSQDMVLVHENVHEGEDDITFDTDEGTSFIAGVPSSCAVG